jgi:DNA repair exonuclease SbcCD ATPase subunit
VVILGSSTFVPFMELKAPHRREVIEDILDIKIFSIMNMLTKIRLKEIDEQVKDIDRDITILESNVQTQKDYIEKLDIQVEETIKNEKEKIQQNINAIDKYNTHIAGLENEINKLKVTINDTQTVVTKAEKISSFQAQFQSKLKECTKHKNFYEENDNCPTCKQLLSNKQELIAENNKEFMKWSQAIEDSNIELRKLQLRLQKIKTTESEIRTTEIDIAKFGQSKTELHNINTKLTHNIETISQQSSDTGEAKGKLSELESNLDEKQNSKLKKIEEHDYLQAAKQMLLDTGIKTKIIKQYLPVINQLINKYLASMDFFVNFRLDGEFKETIKSRYRDEFSYTSFSEGEKMRINLALLFTWRAIAKMKNSISTNLLLLDEIFDSSLDGQGTDDFLKILNTLDNENVFIISHKTDMIADKFTNVIKYEKVGNFTKVVE